jgi:membrane-bound ClpP family serine protease
MISLIIFLIVVGIILVLLEFLVIPGTTISAIAGLLLISSGIYLSYTNLGSNTGHLVFAGTAIATTLAIIFSLRSKTWKKAMLNTEITGVANTYEMTKIQVGDKGITMSRLAPMGKVMVNDNVYEAKTFSQFVDQKTEIEIIKIEQNIIIVKPLNK